MRRVTAAALVVAMIVRISAAWLRWANDVPAPWESLLFLTVLAIVGGAWVACAMWREW